MKRALSALIFATGTLAAQPAAPADQPLAQNPAEDLFIRGKNLHDQAAKLGDAENRVAVFLKAAEILDQYIRTYPNHPNAEMAWYFLGDSYFMAGQPEKQKDCFKILINRYGEGKWAAAAAYLLAADHLAKGQYDFAAPLYERFARNAGVVEDRPRGSFWAGRCYALLGRDREALVAFKKVIEDPAGMPFNPGAKFYSAQVLLKTGRFKESLAYYEDVLSNRGNAVKLRGESALGASAAAAKLGQNDLAEKYLKLILTEDGMDEFRPDAQTALMDNALANKDYDEVISLYRRNAVKAEGEKEAARLMTAARAYMELKKPNDAQMLFRQVESLVKPENPLAFQAAYYRLHCFFQIEGANIPDQVDGFLEIYRKTRPPDDPRINTALFIKAEALYADKKNLDEAAETFRQINVNALSEENRPTLLYKRGWCLAEKGDAAAAIRSLAEFITKYPKDPRFYSALAERAKSFKEIGETNKAISDFDQLTADGVPEDLSSYAWLESARLRRTEKNVPDMVLRYKGLIAKVPSLSSKLQAEANYWIGWGLVTQNKGGEPIVEAIPYLEKARKLDAEIFRKPVGVLLILAYRGSEDAQKLSAEINLAIDGKYIEEVPEEPIRWAANQAFAGNDYPTAARFLGLIAHPDEPRATPREIWRFLAKSRLEIKDGTGALAAVNNVLEVEDNPGWKGDAMVDKGRALLLLGRTAESRQTANEATDLNPQGRARILLTLLTGDLFIKEGNVDRAIADYIRATLGVDADLKPLALYKLANAYDQKGEKADADKARAQLAKDFPNWKAPVEK